MTIQNESGIVYEHSREWSKYARVAESADAHVWGACGAARTGSSPVSRTRKKHRKSDAFFNEINPCRIYEICCRIWNSFAMKYAATYKDLFYFTWYEVSNFIIRQDYFIFFVRKIFHFNNTSQKRCLFSFPKDSTNKNRGTRSVLWGADLRWRPLRSRSTDRAGRRESNPTAPAKKALHMNCFLMK